MKDVDWAKHYGEFDSGPWSHGPIKCLILRVPKLGHLCGYVGVSPGHPWYGIDESAIEEDAQVHGGLTFSGRRETHWTDIWWLGFDCAHSGDAVPGIGLILDGDVYRDWAYVKAEVNRLADIAAEVGT